MLDSPQINSGPKTTSSERRTELVPEVVFVELCAFCNRLQTVEKVELRIASSSRKHEAASLVRLRRPSTRHRTRSQKSSRRRRARADERIVTLAWFTRNRFFPLREGSMWKEATAETHKSAIERDILATFGDLPLAEIDKVMLQTQVKALRSGCRMVGKALPLLLEGDLRRGHRAGVRDEKSGTQAVPAKASPRGGQDYSGWRQLRLVLASVPLRDCILLTLDMTETFRPSELFALRWRGFDMDARTLTVRQTAYRGELRDFGKTKKSLRTVHLPDGLATELWLWKQECPDRSAEAFIFPNARKRNGSKTNGFIRTDNYRARVLKKLAAKLGLAKLNFQVLRRTMATLAQTKGGVKDVQGILGHSKADTTVNVYMQPIEAGVRSTLDAIYSELTAREEVAAGS